MILQVGRIRGLHTRGVAAGAVASRRRDIRSSNESNATIAEGCSAMSFLALAAAAVCAGLPRPFFQHSWDTLPVFWFSANESALEGPSGQALMAKFPIAILAWQTDVKGAPAWRHSEEKMRRQAAELKLSAPHTSVLAYIQGQLVEPWYDSQWKLMPPPCGNDTTGIYSDYFLMDNHTGVTRPAEWPSPDKAGGCEWMWNYDHSKETVREYFLNEVVLPVASIDNMFGVWFDSSDFLPCTGMGPYNMPGFNNMTISPRDSVARERLFNGTVAWKKAVATALNQRGQIPIYSSVNSWNHSGCPYDEEHVAKELAGLSHGRFYEGWGGSKVGASCDEIANARAEAEAGIAVFANNIGPLTTYQTAAFLVGAGNQSFFASATGWTDPGTVWQPEFYDQPLGKPLGRAEVSGTKWTRHFEHTTVTLDCGTKTAEISDWPVPPPPPPTPPTPPTPPPTPPPPQPPTPTKGRWSVAWNCTSCEKSRSRLKILGAGLSLEECKSACVGTPTCRFANFNYGPGTPRGSLGCDLYSSCSPPMHLKTCGTQFDGWWNTFIYGR